MGEEPLDPVRVDVPQRIRVEDGVRVLDLAVPDVEKPHALRLPLDGGEETGPAIDQHVLDVQLIRGLLRAA